MVECGANGVPRPELRPFPVMLLGPVTDLVTGFSSVKILSPPLPNNLKTPTSNEQHPGTHEGRGGNVRIPEDGKETMGRLRSP